MSFLVNFLKFILEVIDGGVLWTVFLELHLYFELLLLVR